MIWLIIALAGGTMLLLALLAGQSLGWADRKFHVPLDPKVEAITAALPGANCAGCGFIGCGEYARAVVAGEATVNKCGPGGTGSAAAIARIMGVELADNWPRRPVVHCSARLDQRLGRQEYVGERTCASANVISGVQGCVYGCLGLGDCVRACNYDAIHVIDGLAVVDYEACTGCGACERACPRHIISSVPFKVERMLVVACSNQDTGKEVKAVCKTGCIGCKACTRFSDLLSMTGNLPTLDYAKYDPATADFSKAMEKCPAESLLFVGKPSQEARVAVRVAQPDRVTADFATTVDKTDWRG